MVVTESDSFAPVMAGLHMESSVRAIPRPYFYRQSILALFLDLNTVIFLGLAPSCHRIENLGMASYNGSPSGFREVIEMLYKPADGGRLRPPQN